MEKRLLNNILTSIEEFKNKQNSEEIVKTISLNSKSFRDQIIKSVSVEPEILKMRIGV